MKKSFIAMGTIAAVTMFVAGCASTGSKEDNAGTRMAEWESFQKGATQAKEVKMCTIPPVNALARTSTVFYKRTADAVIDYIEVTKGNAKTQKLQLWYASIPETRDSKRPVSSEDQRVSDQISEICFETTDCNDGKILDSFNNDKKNIDARAAIIKDWYAKNPKTDTRSALAKDFDEMLLVNAYLDFKDTYKAKEKGKDRVEFSKETEKDKAVWDKIQEGKNIFVARLKAKGIDTDKTISECKKMLAELGEATATFATESVTAIQQINQKYAPQIVAATQAELPLKAKVFGRSATEEDALKAATAKREKLQDELKTELDKANVTIGGIGDQFAFSGKGLAWVIDNYMDIKTTNSALD